MAVEWRDARGCDAEDQEVVDPAAMVPAQLGTMWPEAVFHVLAHVSAGAEAASSLYDPRYVADAAAQMGSLGARGGEEDIALIGASATSHDALVDMQSIAWLFRGPTDAHLHVGCDLAAIDPSTLCARSLLPRVLRAGVGAELVRARAELELAALASWRRSEASLTALDAELSRVERAAPSLADHAVACVRSLGRRGRVFGRDIWVGLPGAGTFAPTAADAAWLAAHEATVHAISGTKSSTTPSSHEEVESEALARLGERAHKAGLGSEHAAWLLDRGWSGGGRGAIADVVNVRE